MKSKIEEGTRLYINITNSCNIDCPFCCMYSSSQNDKFMDFDTYKNIIDTFSSKPKTFELQLEGGEPLLHKNIYLFIEYAVYTGKCSRVNILTNGILLENHLRRIVDLAKWYKIPFSIKISVNYWLLKQHKDHLKLISKYIFATEYIENFNIILNVRKRKNDEWIEEEIDKYNLRKYSNIFYLQSYGKLLGSDYKKPVIVQNIEDWYIFASDGKCFCQDLIARSEHEKEISTAFCNGKK